MGYTAVVGTSWLDGGAVTRAFLFTPASVLALVGTYSLLRRSPAMQEERRLDPRGS